MEQQVTGQAVALDVQPVATEGSPYEVSFSRLELAEQCLWRWSQRYIHGREEPPNQFLVLGTAVHQVAAQAAMFLRDNRDLPPSKSVREWIAAATEEAKVSGVLTKTDLLDIGTLSRRAVAELGDTVLPILRQHPDAEMWVEAEVRFPVPGHPSVIFHGYVDVAVVTDGGGLAIDWKTGRLPYPPESRAQLFLYAEGLRAVRPDVPTWRVWYRFLRQDDPPPVAVTEEHRQRALTWLATATGRLMEALASGEFPARPGGWCKYCPWGAECPLSGHPVPEQDVWGLEQARELFGLLLAAEARVKALQSLLRRYVEDNGPVECGGEWLGLFSSERLVWRDKGRLIEVLRASNLDPFEYLRPDEARLQELAASLESVRSIAEARQSSRFEHRAYPPGGGPDEGTEGSA